MRLFRFLRKWHRWLAVLFLIPMGITVVTGIFLVYRKELPFMARPNASEERLPISEYSSLEKVSEKLDELNLGLDRVSHLRLYPHRGTLIVMTKKGEVYSLSGRTLDLLGQSSGLQRLMIRLHEGSYWGKESRLFIFGPMSLGMIFLWVSGVLIAGRYYLKRFKNRKLKKASSS